MTIDELKISAYLYTAFSGDDKKYKEIVDNDFDFTRKEDCALLFTFLRNWGCRQFKIEDEKIATRSLQKWYSKYNSYLPPSSKNLVGTSEKMIRSYSQLFNDLMSSHAANKVSETKVFQNTFGPVGTAKALFAMRKNMFPPWDNPIIEAKEVSKDGNGYCEYMIDVKEKLIKLRESCHQLGIEFDSLASHLKRSHSSLPKLIDEYYWVNITRGCVAKDILKLTNAN